MTLSRSQAKKWVDRVLEQASFGDVRVQITDERRGHLRFAQGQPTTEGDVERLEIHVTAAKDGRHATVTGNRTDDAGLAALVEQAEKLAELAPPDPELMPPLGKTKHATVKATDRAAANLGAAERAKAVAAAITTAQDKGVDVAGFLSHGETSTVVADRAGLFGFHQHTRVSMTATCRTPDGTGSARAGFLSYAAAGLDGAALAEDAALRALKSKDPKKVDPGRYTVVLMPDAVADLLSFFSMALRQRTADEGRSWFSKPGGGSKVGEQLFDARVTITSDPSNPKYPSSPFARDGRPQQRVEWVKGGRLLSLTTSRYWADKQGIASRPRPDSWFMEGTTASLDDLIAGVDKGILVSRFWYNRMLARRSLTATGLTRDGTFLIEGGRIAAPIGNLRYNDSPITLLTKLEALGTPERAAFSGDVVVVPPLVVRDFNFDSTSDAI